MFAQESLVTIKSRYFQKTKTDEGIAYFYKQRDEANINDDEIRAFCQFSID